MLTKMLRPGSLRERIILFFTVLLLGVSAAVFLVVLPQISGIFRDHTFQELAGAERVLRRVIAQNQIRLAESASLLAADFAFRTAVTSDDQPTLHSALKNHSARLGADVAILHDLEGAVRADTLPSEAARQPHPLPSLIQKAQQEGVATSLAILNGRAYQLAVVPVLAPDPIGWVAIGIELNDKFARELRTLLDVHVSFMLRAARHDFVVIASTQANTAMLDLTDAVRRSAHANDGIPAATLTIKDFDSRLSSIDSVDSESVLCVLQRTEASASEIFQPLLSTLGLIAAGGLGLCLIGGALMVSFVTGPLDRLAAVARRIREGDFEARSETSGDDEFGEFAATFDHMLETIAGREKEILRLAYEDPLTGLPNRVSLQRELDNRAGTGTSFVLMLLDLQRFRLINSTLGYEAGDELLNIVATRFRSLVKATDFVFRTGSNVFAVICAMKDGDQVKMVADRLQDALSHRIFVGVQEVDVTAAVGAVQFPEQGSTGAVLLRRAEIALYHAKHANGGFCLYEPALDATRRDSLHLLGDLRRAEEKGELLLMYQPKVDLRRGKVTSVEALIRWRHPVRGMVPPGEFLPFAEQTGAIRRITRWVIGEAIAQIERWEQDGLNLQVSINISARDLADDALVGYFATALLGSAQGASALCVEITESAMMEDSSVAFYSIERLRQLGIAVSIDDYGTGYSSLSYIKNLKASELKIDRAFVNDLDSSEEDKAIVRSTIELGHNLGLRVVAEGVETPAQLGKLCELGCDYAQGYLLSRPLAADALASWLRDFDFSAVHSIKPTAVAPDGRVQAI